MENLLDQIRKTGDIKQIPPEKYDELAAEIRRFLIGKISVTGGHLASNLGAVELTMALHLFLDLPQDRIVWDVGHQCYTHKILTGRRDGFDTLRKYGGMSGFPKREESECDSFDTGHASNSISVGLGMVRAREILGEKRRIVSVIGDGALTGGMAYEALNNAAKLDTNFIIILNDNKMSISENVGGMPRYLNEIRTSDSYLQLRDRISYQLNDTVPRLAETISRAKKSIKQLMIPGMFFEDMGITYLGPVDGHDIQAMKRTLEEASRVNKAVLIHVLTKKGRGYVPAENHPARFHGTSPFEVETGLPRSAGGSKAAWTDVFGTVIMKLGKRNSRVCAITAAMSDGVGLRRFKHAYPERFFDVGIAEEHAVTFAAGLAASGMRPVVCIYSTFLQRAYDQICEDVCLQRLPVVFAIDRAGLVGADGETHQGIYDLSYLSSIPGMSVMAPKNKWELSDMMKFAVAGDRPVAVRYPRGAACDEFEEYREPVEWGKAEVLRRGEGVLLFALGSMVSTAGRVQEALAGQGISSTLVNARFARPFDSALLEELLPTHSLVVTMEENVRSGGFGEHVQAWMNERQAKAQVLNISIPDTFVRHGSPDQLRREVGIDEESVTRRILEVLGKESSR